MAITESLMMVFSLATGMCVGSFLNVCIYRIPAARSIVFPGSSCPNCHQPIRWFDNIPVISYALLRGRCRRCHAAISPRYPLVEFLAGLFALCTYLNWGISAASLIYFMFICALITLTFIDIDHQILPDVITLSGMGAGLCIGFLLPDMTFMDSVIGLLAGGGSLYAVAWGYQMATGREGMGGGDIKLLAMMGTFIGWKGVIFTIFSGSLIGALIGGAIMVINRKTLKLAIPFGPFLSIGAMIYLFWGPDIIDWYVSGLGGLN